MNDPLNHLPSREREKVRRHLRSPEAYKKLRESVKGPEEVAREMEKNERIAEFRYVMETQPRAREQLKQRLVEELREKGMDALLDTEVRPLSSEAEKAITEGKFRIVVTSHPTKNYDTLAVVPGAEGTVQERIPLKPHASEQYFSLGLQR